MIILPELMAVQGILMTSFSLPLGSGFIHEVFYAFGWPSINPRDAMLRILHAALAIMAVKSVNLGYR